MKQRGWVYGCEMNDDQAKLEVAKLITLTGLGPADATTLPGLLDELRFGVLVRMHDLESTRRENKYLRIMLEEQSSE